MSSNFHATPRCPQVLQGSARQFTPIKAAGLPTCLLGPPVVKLPLLLLHSTDTFLRCCTLGQTCSGHPPCGFRGTKERPIVTTRMWKNVFSNELFIIEIFIKTTPPSLRVKIFNSWRQTQPWYWVPGVRPLHEVNMRNRHSAEGLGAQFQVYSRMTFHDDFAMLQQYLQLLAFQGNSICFNKEQLWGRSHSFCPLKPLVKEYPSPRAVAFELPGFIQKKYTFYCCQFGVHNFGHTFNIRFWFCYDIKEHKNTHTFLWGQGHWSVIHYARAHIFGWWSA